jgi:hypothetical protein
MPAPTVATYSVAALVAAHTSFRDLIDSESSEGFIRIRDAADVLLAEIPLDDPCGTVDTNTGQLTFDITGPDTSADATGTAAYAEICDSTGTPHLSLPVQSGSAAVPGVLVMNTLSIVATGPVEIISATIG